MSFHLVNGLMLLGLAGVALPVLAHLLSRKKYDVQLWGAMQFLELGRNTRRKIQLEQLMLMLMRMGLIALIAIALARPWAQGGWISNLVSTQTRDVVLVIDGSYSMGWEGKATTPHAAAVQWAHKLLEELRPGDTITLLDARDHVRAVIESPTRDFRYVRDELTKLPAPSGTSNLAEASARGVQALSRTTNLARDVIVLTDGQAKGWRADDVNLWTRFDELRSQPSVQPRVWVIDVSERQADDRTNFAVDPITLSRELTVPDFPVRITTKIRSFGGTVASNRRVYLEIDGQRLNDRTLQVQLPPAGEATVDFDYKFPALGSHILSVVLDADNLPGDNRSDAAISVAEALPALIIDGAPHLDPVRTESFFARAAFGSGGQKEPWVKANVVPADRFQKEDLAGPEVVILANVKRLPEELNGAIQEFVARGGGLFIAPGDQVDGPAWNESLGKLGDDLLPANFVSIEKDPAPELKGIRPVDSSLELPWMSRFQARHDGGFTDARFAQWWKLTPAVIPDDKAGAEKAADAEASQKPAEKGKAKPRPEATPPVIAARLDNGDPLLIVRRYGRGGVALLAGPIDADWSTLPAKADFVPFLHEVVFFLASGKTARNVAPGVPLQLPVSEDLPLKQFAFFGPNDTEFKAEASGDAVHPSVKLDDTTLEGVYTFRAKDEKQDGPKLGPEKFVVRGDRSESDLTPLDDTQKALLADHERLAFAETLEEVKAGMFEDSSRAEMWPLMMFLFLALLVGEVWMTRRLVQGGHAMIDDDAVDGDDVIAEPVAAPPRPAAVASGRK